MNKIKKTKVHMELEIYQKYIQMQSITYIKTASWRCSIQVDIDVSLKASMSLKQSVLALHLYHWTGPATVCSITE